MSIRILRGDCRIDLRLLPDASVHCIVTSPPYWGLRDYGTAKWEGGDPSCGHIERTAAETHRSSTLGPNRDGLKPDNAAFKALERQFRGICGKCGAQRIDSQLGLEATPDEYVANMVGVFREARRVLRDDGTLWLNLGDSYSTHAAGRIANPMAKSTLAGVRTQEVANESSRAIGKYRKYEAIPEKNLIGIPWRVAFALQADGWWLRQDIIWAKPNPMPESVTDRCTKSHEYLFLLSKSASYYYDADAVREESAEPERAGTLERSFSTSDPASSLRQDVGRSVLRTEWRNKRSVWTVTTQPFSEAHFATFPPALIEPCILAGTSEYGCCRECGAPWVRVTSRPAAKTVMPSKGTKTAGLVEQGGMSDTPRRSSFHGPGWRDAEPDVTVTLRWEPSCRCKIPGLIDATPFSPVPCTVLDPFGGAGTTGLVADRLKRNAVLIELNPAYAEMAERRLKDDAGMFAEVA